MNTKVTIAALLVLAACGGNPFPADDSDDGGDGDTTVAVPEALAGHGLTLRADGAELVYSYDTKAERTGITALLSDLGAAGIRFNDLQTSQSSLEDIFVGLLRANA